MTPCDRNELLRQLAQYDYDVALTFEIAADPDDECCESARAILPSDVENDDFIRDLRALAAWNNYRETTMALLWDPFDRRESSPGCKAAWDRATDASVQATRDEDSSCACLRDGRRRAKHV